VTAPRSARSVVRGGVRSRETTIYSVARRPVGTHQSEGLGVAVNEEAVDVADHLFELHAALPRMAGAERRTVIKFLLDIGDLVGAPDFVGLVLCPRATCGHA
jgi:hypothetical protein